MSVCVCVFVWALEIEVCVQDTETRSEWVCMWSLLRQKEKERKCVFVHAKITTGRERASAQVSKWNKEQMESKSEEEWKWKGITLAETS